MIVSSNTSNMATWSTRSNSLKSGEQGATNLGKMRAIGMSSQGTLGSMGWSTKVKTYTRTVAPHVLERHPKARSISRHCGYEPDRDIAFFEVSAEKKEEYRNSLRATGSVTGLQNGLRLCYSLPEKHRSQHVHDSTPQAWNNQAFPGARATDFHVMMRTKQKSQSAQNLSNKHALGSLMNKLNAPKSTDLR